MLHEPSTLASLVARITRTLKKDYGIDPEPLLGKLGIPALDEIRPGGRLPETRLRQYWNQATYIAGDEYFGLTVGQNMNLADYYVLGYAWMASENLKDAFQRLVRYVHVVSSSKTDLQCGKEKAAYAIWEAYPEPSQAPTIQQGVAGVVGVLELCKQALQREVIPVRVELQATSDPSGAYETYFACPIEFGSKRLALVLSEEDAEEQLASAIPDMAAATDRVAERYIESLDTGKVATRVRQLLIQTLPTGGADQETIASKLHRSASTLQRQLSAEGTNYRELLESTRQSLAEDYLKDGKHSQAQIAYLVGFSDQSNFARAFKRWTGMSPGQFQQAA